jgi:hypothetical protein
MTEGLIIIVRECIMQPDSPTPTMFAVLLNKLLALSGMTSREDAKTQTPVKFSEQQLIRMYVNGTSASVTSLSLT